MTVCREPQFGQRRGFYCTTACDFGRPLRLMIPIADWSESDENS
jgi:hypothetical protein